MEFEWYAEWAVIESDSDLPLARQYLELWKSFMLKKLDRGQKLETSHIYELPASEAGPGIVLVPRRLVLKMVVRKRGSSENCGEGNQT